MRFFPLTDDLSQVLINGEWRVGRSAAPSDVFDPSSNDVLFRLQSGTADDVDHAVEAAWRAYREGPWRRMPGLEKGKLLMRLATLMRDRTDVLAELEARNTGIPIRQSRFEVAAAARHLEYFGGFAGKVEGVATPLTSERLMYTIREPLG